MTFLSSPDSKWFSVIFVQANSSSCLRGRKPLRPPPYTHMHAQTDDNHAILLLPVLVYISNSSFRGEKEPGSEGTAQKRLLSTHLIITLSTPPPLLSPTVFLKLLSFSVQRPNSIISENSFQNECPYYHLFRYWSSFHRNGSHYL